MFGAEVRLFCCVAFVEKDTVQRATEECEPPAAVQHVYVSVWSRRTAGGSGKSLRIDVTPPELLLFEANQLVEAAFASQNAKEAVHQSLRRLALTRIVLGGDGAPWLLAQCHLITARAYWSLYRPPYCRQTYEHCLDAGRLLDNVAAANETRQTDQIPLPSNVELMELCLETFVLLGKSCLLLKKLRLAVSALKKAERFLNKRRRVKHGGDEQFDADAYATEIRLTLARVRAVAGDVDGSQESFEKVLELLRNRFGSPNDRLVEVYHTAAKLSQQAESTVEYSLKAYETASQCFGGRGEIVADCAKHLAFAYAKHFERIDGGDEAAVKYFKKAIALYENCETKDRRRMEATLRLRLAEIRFVGEGLGRAGEALSSAEQLELELAGHFGQQSLATAELCRLVASFHSRLGAYLDAAHHLRRALAIETELRGVNHARVQATRLELDRLLKRLPAATGSFGARTQQPPFKAVTRGNHTSH